jgi:replication fork clamp-binding protein CrfC
MKDIITEDLTEHEQQVKAFKRNSNRLLHHRNIYVLLASVGEETMNQCSKLSDIAGYMLIRKITELAGVAKTNDEQQERFPRYGLLGAVHQDQGL